LSTSLTYFLEYIYCLEKSEHVSKIILYFHKRFHCYGHRNYYRDDR